MNAPVAKAVVSVTAFIVVACSGPPEQVSSREFASPDAAAAAFAEALRADDERTLAVMLGPEAGALLNTGDPVATREERRKFLDLYSTRHELVPRDQNSMTLEVGEAGWPLPIPIVKRNGHWEFDAAGGAEEIVIRRIGRNEFRAIDVCRGFVAAQRDYARLNGGVYAVKLRSDPGQRNGLYWETSSREEQSPAGPWLARAAAEGYEVTGSEPAPYHGYFYRSLHAQGIAAPGGAATFSRDGQPARSFALVAFPATYGASGVMTFIVGEDGIVYEKDLGAGTRDIAAKMPAFNPDTTWSRIEP
jgi:hypothetical protein